MLSPEAAQQRREMLARMRTEPISPNLEAYFKTLQRGAPSCNTTTFIEGVNAISHLTGQDRSAYYGNKLLGLHYANEYVQLWNNKYIKHPITMFDQDFRYQCPPDWSYKLMKSGRSLVYIGEETLSQALNKLLQGPTTLNCGMWCQFVIWMAIRYLVGDHLFDRITMLPRGQFVIGQAAIDGLLEPFLDNPMATTTNHELHTPMQILTVFNHPAYLAKHPNGEEKLQNTILIEDRYHIFDPGSPNTVSKEILEENLREGYNRPRDHADFEKLFFFEAVPNEKYVDSNIDGRTCAERAKEAEKYATHTLSKKEWDETFYMRKAMASGLQRTVNIQRLLGAIEVCKGADAVDNIGDGLLSVARDMQRQEQLLQR